MPEEDLETGELKEHLDHAVEHGEGGPRWTQYLSVSTAVLAVLAAVASLVQGRRDTSTSPTDPVVPAAAERG